MALTSKVAAGVKDGGKFLQAGIHNAIFKGIDKQIVEGKNDISYTTMAIIFDIDGFGEYVHRLFEPTNADRIAGPYGDNPSQVEQFFVTIRHLLETTNPAIAAGIDDGSVEISGSFTDVINQVKTHSAAFVGKPTQVKMLPQKSGFNQFPGFPAKVNRSGQLYLTTRFIGNGLTLTPNEVTAIEKAKNATPTNMASRQTGGSSAGIMEGMAADMATANDVDDLPF